MAAPGPGLLGNLPGKIHAGVVREGEREGGREREVERGKERRREGRTRERERERDEKHTGVMCGVDVWELERGRGGCLELVCYQALHIKQTRAHTHIHMHTHRFRERYLSIETVLLPYARMCAAHARKRDLVP